MQASTRIGIALCVLVAGGALAGLFRKSPGPVASPADRAENQLALRQPDDAPVMAANAANASWQNPSAATPHAERPAASLGRDGRPLAGVKAADRAALSPLPLPRMPELASGDFAASGSWNSDSARPLAIPLGSHAATPPRATAGAAGPDDDWQLHEVTDGDTLAKLAERYYGDPALAETIQRANSALVKDTNILPIGAFLKIPARSTTAPAATGRTPQGEGWRQKP